MTARTVQESQLVGNGSTTTLDGEAFAVPKTFEATPGPQANVSYK